MESGNLQIVRELDCASFRENWVGLVLRLDSLEFNWDEPGRCCMTDAWIGSQEDELR